jgi:hypothetical protein
MRCRRCSREIPAHLIGCEYCLIERGVEFLEKRQIEILPSVYCGKADLVLVTARGIARHVQLFGEPYRMYCGAQLGPHYKRTREPYNEVTVKKLCVPCRIRLKALMEEALAATVPAHSASSPAPQ